MMTPEQIERFKLAGQAKREERRAKREALYRINPKLEELPLPADFEDRLHAAWAFLERLSTPEKQLSKEKEEEIKKLFLPDATEELRFKAYRKYFHDYEALIYHSWYVSDELSDAAFSFWNEVLSHQDAKFSGNSIIRILGGRPNKNSLKIMQNHKDKFLEESSFARVLKDLVFRHDARPGVWNFKTSEYDLWTPEEKRILKEIKSIF